MMNNKEAIKTLQEISSHHEKSLTTLQATTTENKQALQDILRQLSVLTVQLGQPVQSTVVQDGSSDTKAIQGKGKLKVDFNDGFPFSPKLVSIELPVFTDQDLEE
ncbi:hypothetical protein PVK06_012308 [Gossypium arboreum]|uniref:Uncharacterized protein n=1 Tax=Gossypium arboreum TaxID=29729 RepID=A0ABR0QB88_GOSAR|nr:hypothetical protein PVK06_012308 [Gossypium arboreum]